LKELHVGIVGAGQLGRMLALAGYPLGVRCLFLDRSADAPGAQVAPILVGDLTDPERLEELAARSDVVTFDWENIPGSALEPLEKTTRIRPPRAALEASQDRMVEKALFSKLKIPVAAHAAIDSLHHVVNGEAGHGDGGQRFHLDAGFSRDLHPCPYFDARQFRVGREIDLDLRDRKRMAERDQVVSAFGRHDAGDAGGAEHVALFRIAFAHDVERGRLHQNAPPGQSFPLGSRLCRNVHHAGFAARAEMGEVFT